MAREDRSRIGIIILAAGASTRLGKPKQLLNFQGASLLRRAAENALATGCENIVAVLGANSAEIGKEIENLPLKTVINENWASGMSSSIKTGLGKLLDWQPTLSAVIIQLCDQPLINTGILNKLITIYEEKRAEIVAAEYTGTVGVPALFAASMFAELLNLSAESGAKQLIKKHLAMVEKVFIPEAEIDVDTPLDYEKLLKNY